MPDEHVVHGSDKSGWWLAAVTLVDGRQGETCATSLATQSAANAAMVANKYTELFEGRLLPARWCDECSLTPSVPCPTAGCSAALCELHFRQKLPPSLSGLEITPATFPPKAVRQSWLCSTCRGLSASPAAPQTSLFVLVSGVTSSTDDKAVIDHEFRRMLTLETDRVAATHELMKSKTLKPLAARVDLLNRQLQHAPQRRNTFLHLIYLHGSGTGAFSGGAFSEVADYINTASDIGATVQAREALTVLCCCDCAPALARHFEEHVRTPLLGFTAPFGLRNGWLYVNTLMHHVADGALSVPAAIRIAGVYPCAAELQPWTINVSVAAAAVLSSAAPAGVDVAASMSASLGLRMPPPGVGAVRASSCAHSCALTHSSMAFVW
jgi:hypothetical protein